MGLIIRHLVDDIGSAIGILALVCFIADYYATKRRRKNGEPINYPNFPGVG